MQYELSKNSLQQINVNDIKQNFNAHNNSNNTIHLRSGSNGVR